MSRVLRYEWIRASTIRSTAVFPLIGVLFAGLGTMVGILSDPEASGTLSQLILSANTPITTVLLTVPFAQAFGHEYRDGTMRLTLSQFPHRGQVFWAKVAVPAVIASVGVLVTVAVVAALDALQGMRFQGGDVVEVVWRSVLFAVLWGLVVAAITVLTRNLAAGIVVPLIWSLLVETLIASLVDNETLISLLPLTAGSGWVATGGVSGWPMVALVGLLVALAWFRFDRSDA